MRDTTVIGTRVKNDVVRLIDELAARRDTTRADLLASLITAAVSDYDESQYKLDAAQFAVAERAARDAVVLAITELQSATAIYEGLPDYSRRRIAEKRTSAKFVGDDVDSFGDVRDLPFLAAQLSKLAMGALNKFKVHQPKRPRGVIYEDPPRIAPSQATRKTAAKKERSP